MKTIEFNGRHYPAFQAEGNAARWVMPFAREVLKDCKTVFDVGCCRHEWAYPGAHAIDPALNQWDARHFPTEMTPDAIFSSHCLEHVADWVGALDYWHSRLKTGGIVFLYLPHPDQEYWLPWNNRKHVNVLTPELLHGYLSSRFSSGIPKWRDVFVTEGHDLNHSFTAVATKA